MGYNTDFNGEIKITPKLTQKQMDFISKMFGDMRDFDPEMAKKLDLTWFNLEFNTEGNLQWDGGEKTYDMQEKIQYLIDKTIEKWPELQFNGEMQADGEETDDNWILKVTDNIVTTEELIITGKKVTCPHCDEDFRLEE